MSIWNRKRALTQREHEEIIKKLNIDHDSESEIDHETDESSKADQNVIRETTSETDDLEINNEEKYTSKSDSFGKVN